LFVNVHALENSLKVDYQAANQRESNIADKAKALGVTTPKAFAVNPKRLAKPTLWSRHSTSMSNGFSQATDDVPVIS
jgi:hypothetical protein